MIIILSNDFNVDFLFYVLVFYFILKCSTLHYDHMIFLLCSVLRNIFKKILYSVSLR